MVPPPALTLWVRARRFVLASQAGTGTRLPARSFLFTWTDGGCFQAVFLLQHWLFTGGPRLRT